MASLSSMLALAKEIDQRKVQGSDSGRIASILNQFVTGGLQGRGLAKEEAAAALINKSKALEIQEREGKIQQQQDNRNMMKFLLGDEQFSQMFPSEKEIVDETALADLGVKKPPRDNTRPGRVKEIFDKSFSFTPKGGLSVQFKSKKKSQANIRQTEKDIETSAFKAAQKDEARRLTATGKFRQGVHSLADIIPPKELVDGYKAHFRARFEGDFDKSDRILRQIKKKGQQKNKLLSEFGTDTLDLDLKLPE